MNCLNCNGALELNPQHNYARCSQCKNIFSVASGALYPFPVDDAARAAIEQALGFSSSPSPESVTVDDAPHRCPSCDAVVEKIINENIVCARCTSCGLLYKYSNGYYVPMLVDAPGGGWDAKFQAVFEEKLGFTYKLRKKPLGIPE